MNIEDRCEEMIVDPGSNFGRSKRCGNKAVSGKYCWVHVRENVAARRDAAEAKRAAKWDAERKAARRAHECERAIKEIAEGRSRDPVAMAIAIVDIWFDKEVDL